MEESTNAQQAHPLYLRDPEETIISYYSFSFERERLNGFFNH
jgi:hypothetical protein